MVIGGKKREVIENIKKSVLEEEFNKKVELNDPMFSDSKREEYLNKFYNGQKHRLLYFFKQRIAYTFLDVLSFKLRKNMEIVGIDNLDNIRGGAIITCNHFNPLDSLIVRKLIRKRYKKNLYIVIQDTNLAMPGFLGFLMNSLNVIPLGKGPNYIIKKFKPELKKILAKNNYVLIYPEEEMWFNYRKPRPCKNGAYRFASENNVPIISCFTEIIDTDKNDNEEFRDVKYKLHVLKPIYLDSNKSIKENGRIMAEIDYQEKIEAYEKAYNKKLDYEFSYQDIAGFKKKN